VALLAVLLVYILTGKLGLALAFGHSSATPVWPPAGIALAALLLLGNRVWPVIFLGAFVVNATTAGSLVTALGIAGGNTLEALVGAYLVRRFARGAAVFERAQDIFKLAALAAVVSTAVSATIGVASLELTGYARWTEAGSIWLTWWCGDASGILLVTPFIVLWGRRTREAALAHRPLEAAALLLSVVATSALVFGGILPESLRRLPTAFVTIPPLLWAAYRFGPLTTSTTLLALATLAVAGTLSGAGPFAARPPGESLPLVQAFLATMALTALPLAAVVSERRRADEAARLRAQQLRVADERNRVLADIARSISASLDIDTVLPRIADGARALCDSDTAAIFLRDEASDAMVPRYRVGPWLATYDTLQIRHGEGLGGLAMATGRPLRTAGYRDDPRVDAGMRTLAEQTGTIALMVVPIVIAAHVAGLLYISNRSARVFGDEEEAVSVRLAEQAAIAIQNARLFAREGAARAEAEAANRSKDRFLAMLSHELRNPLGAISNAVHVLERVGDAPAARRAREIIGRQVQHLGRLVDDLLDVSRATTGKIILRREVVELAAIVDRAVAGLAARQPGAARVVVDARPVRVTGDAVRLEQVVTNLLENAAKYTPADGRVGVTVRMEDGAAMLVVEDSGVGIAPELLPHVFDLFVQADRSLDRAAGGLGIGLTLVRQIVELHGGTVEATSAGVGHGSRFTVRLPATAAAASEPPSRSAAQETATQRILVVEDNDDAREMLCQLVRLLGHEVHEATDGPAAVDGALRLKPDFTVVDIGLPGMDGYEVARRIRANTAGRGLKLVALTGYGRREDRERALGAGFDEHLVKPIDPARLAAMLSASGPSCDPEARMKSSPDGGHQ
jgi:signal transduction histidine kinase/integral membrane sensor domain MASE1/ActR/RegA family two-component response regulator